MTSLIKPIQGVKKITGRIAMSDRIVQNKQKIGTT